MLRLKSGLSVLFVGSLQSANVRHRQGSDRKDLLRKLSISDTERNEKEKGNGEIYSFWLDCHMITRITKKKQPLISSFFPRKLGTGRG